MASALVVVDIEDDGRKMLVAWTGVERPEKTRFLAAAIHLLWLAFAATGFALLGVTARRGNFEAK